ncbi:FAD-dependent oxidoreductase [Ferrovibrio sp.]|uniref:FAD-dependent oxidoreductase n=1 Tax=Ferrovibrio sp. TaxID=1917215 RepID=UPI00262DC333|nr:FAD-dependent oxidoreductase [Ferrovibrio sp.]
MATRDVDVAILGGGIAGLWLLARLQTAGYSALLLENNALGAGQTLASQGIIHGGLKYALDLKLNAASDALADMPARWRACLAGTGEVDLRGVPLAAERHLFWARKTLASRIAGFFGSKLVRGRVDALAPADWPAVLRDPEHVAAVYALDECVLDVPVLLQALARPRQVSIKRIHGDVHVSPADEGVVIDCHDGYAQSRRLHAGALVSTAGAGNETLLAQFGLPAAAAQRRPLQMVLIDKAPGPLWAHCFDASDKPRVTVTTHKRADGSLVWYVGGQLAETGARQSAGALITAAKAEFAALLPGQDFSACRYATLAIDRAEGATDDGRKPDGPVLRRAAPNCWLAWPTKLALAPQLADQVLAELPPPSGRAADLSHWPAPQIAPAPWDSIAWEVAAWK